MPKFGYSTVWGKPKVADVPKTSWIHSAILTKDRLVTDGYWAMANTAVHMCCAVKIFVNFMFRCEILWLSTIHKAVDM